jgi:hypothetical protein
MNKKDSCINHINDLFETYNENEEKQDDIENVLLNIEKYIHYKNMIENASKNDIEKLSKNIELIQSRNKFTSSFLMHNNYFYLSNINTYYYYDGLKFSLINEDNIQHKLLSTMNTDLNLQPCKYRTKNNIMKEIKSKTLFNAIPETETIQFIIKNMKGMVFNNKDETKYFLTIIGDYILKKSKSLHYFINPKAKYFLHYLSIYCIKHFGIYGMYDYFRTKYQDHKYENIRLVNINHEIEEENDNYEEFFKKNIITFVCVCCHYSHRYKDADNFISTCKKTMKDYVRFVCSNDKKQILEVFDKNYITNSDNENDVINQKNLMFLWKHFLSKFKIPNVIYMNTLNENFQTLLGWTGENHNYKYKKSELIDNINSFLSFWTKHIKIENSELNNYDISELLEIFKKETNTEAIDNRLLEKIIRHYLPNYYHGDKVIYNITSSLWEKKKDVFDIIKKYENDNEISVYEIYEYYTKECDDKGVMTSNKRYFEKCYTFLND